MNAERIAREMHGRKCGSRWMARCPAHEDRSPSLSIRESDGKVLLHCFTGCPQADVIEALRVRGLWPERERRSFTPAERRDWGLRRRAAERAAERIDNWKVGRGMRLKDEKLDAAERDDIERLAVAARALYELEHAEPAELAGQYAAVEPGLRARDEAAGRRWRALCERVCAWIVTAARPGKVQDHDNCIAA